MDQGSRSGRTDLDPPLARWEIGNFKSATRGSVDLFPLTVIVGPNSGGKSTLIQSILLFVQAAQDHRVAGETFPLNGSLVRLGGFDDVLSAFAEDPSIEVGGSFRLGAVRHRRLIARRYLPDLAGDEGTLKVQWNVRFRDKATLEPGSTYWEHIDLRAAVGGPDSEGRQTMMLEAHRVEPKSESETALLLGRQVSQVSPRRLVYRSTLSRLRSYEGVSYCEGHVTLEGVQIPIEAISVTAGVPTAVYMREDLGAVLTEQWLTALDFAQTSTRGRRRPAKSMTRDLGVEEIVGLAVNEIRSWIQSLDQGIPERPVGADLREVVVSRVPPDQLDQLRRGGFALLAEQINPQVQGLRTVLLPESLSPEAEVGDEVLNFFSERVTYLGPLRQEPLVVHQTVVPTKPRFLGVRGEYTAAVLHERKDSRIEGPWPDGSVGPGRVRDFLDAWLKYLKAAESADTQDLGRLGLQVLVTPEGLPKALDLTSVGVGVSQVLPVLLACLLWEAGEVVLLEQPELHLHPAMQQRLGDFFLHCARSGRQLIVETHSEYLVTRLRRLIAEDLEDHDLNLVGFVYATIEGGQSSYQPVQPTRFGALDSWPSGFFDQTAVESQQLLQAAFRKKEAKGRPRRPK